MKFTDCIEIVGSKPTLYEGTKQYVSTGAVEEYFINEKSIEEYSYKERPSRADLVGKSGDILFAKMAETKKTLILDKETENYLFSTGFFAIRPKNGILTTKCLYYLLNSKNFLSQKDKNSSGATQKAITNAGLEKININIPLFSKQDQIVKQFDLLTDIIKKYQSQLKKLDSLIKSRFIEMFGDPITNPKHWNTKAITELCENIMGGGTPSKSKPEYFEGTIPWVSPKDMKSLFILDSQDHITEDAVNNSSAKKIKSDSILMVIRSGILKHTLPVAMNKVEVTINQDMKAFIPSSEINPYYLLFYFKGIERDVLSGVRAVTADNIDFNQFKKRHVILPSKQMQNDFAAFVQQIGKSKFAVQKSLEKAETLYKSLMQEYFA